MQVRHSRSLGAILVAALLIAAVFAFWSSRQLTPVVLAPSFASASSLRLLAVGRQGYGNAMTQRIADAMERAAAEQPTYATLYLGDNFYPKGVSSVDDSQWGSKFERLYDGAHLRGMPFFAVVGNHDAAGNAAAEVEYARRRLGSARWQMDALYYVRDFGDVDGRVLLRVVFLDTIALREQPAAQLEFARRALQSPGDPVWRAVAGHYAIRSVTHEPYTRERTLSALLPQFQQMNVDLYVSANDRFQQILDRPGEPLHVSTSGGSEKQEMGVAPEDPDRDAVIADAGFAVISASPTEIAVELRNPDGKVMRTVGRRR